MIAPGDAAVTRSSQPHALSASVQRSAFPSVVAKDREQRRRSASRATALAIIQADTPDVELGPLGHRPLGDERHFEILVPPPLLAQPRDQVGNIEDVGQTASSVRLAG